MTIQNQLLSGLLLALLGSAAGDAKDWSLRDEVYQCGTCGMTLAELQSAGITLVSHVPCTREWFQEAAKYGIRGMPYISLYKVYDASAAEVPTQDPFWRAVDMTGHPEWVYVDRNGKPARPFGNPQYPKINWASCTNTAGIAEAYCRGAAGVIQTGAGGVFIDNVLPATTCYGPKFGVHQHLYPDRDNVYSFKIALRRVQETVKGFGPDHAVMINVGRWDLWKGFGDCTMLESFIYNVDVRPGPGGWVGKKIVRVKQWPQILATIKDTAAYVDAGGNFVTLEYLPVDPQAAYYTYACAKLADFLWSGNVPTHRDVARTLYRCHMQRACGPLREAAGIYYRHYPQAMAAVNTTDHTVSVEVAAPPGCRALADVFSNRRLPVDAGRVRLEIPPQAGRVYLSPAQVIDGYLRETLLALQTAEDRALHSADVRGLQAAVHAAETAQHAAAGPDGRDAAHALAQLCRTLASCRPAAANLGCRLAGGPEISRADVRRLLASAAAPPMLSCKIERQRVTLTSGDTAWVLGRPGPLIAVDGRGVNFGLSIASRHAAQGWFAPQAIESARLRTDTPDRKQVEIVVSLRGAKSGETLPDARLILVAEVVRGEPGLKVQSALRNTSRRVLDCYVTWSTAACGNWCSYPRHPATRSDRYVQVARSDWTYVHPGCDGGQGLLVIADGPQSYSPFGGNLYSQPRSAPLAAGQERAIDFELSPVAGSWQKDPAAMSAFWRARLYAAQAFLLTVGDSSPICWTAAVIAGRSVRSGLVRGTSHRVAIEELSLRSENDAMAGDCRLGDGLAATLTPPPSLDDDQDCRLAVAYTADLPGETALPLVDVVDLLPRPSVSLTPGNSVGSWQGTSGTAALVVTNRLEREVRGRLTVEAPASYEVEPLEPVRLAAGQTRTMVVILRGKPLLAAPRGVRAVLRVDSPSIPGEQEIHLTFAGQRTPSKPAASKDRRR